MAHYKCLFIITSNFALYISKITEKLFLVLFYYFIAEEDAQIIPAEMDNDCVAQTWFRFLHVLGNPVDLCRPKVISQTPKFMAAIMAYEHPIDPANHPCLKSLPKIFLKAMKGISVMVDGLLGKGDAGLNLKFDI